MFHLVKGKALHLILFCLLVLYVFNANALYTTFILKNGKPVSGKIQRPTQTKDFQYGFAPTPVEEVRYGGEDLYALRGYALHNTLPSTKYLIKIVLRSDNAELVFTGDPPAVPNLLLSRPDYNKSMDEAEFRMLFSKNVLKVGKYQIGILLTDKQGRALSYQWTASSIERTPNTIRFLPGNQP